MNAKHQKANGLFGIRQRITELKNQISEVEAAPLPAADIEQAIRAQFGSCISAFQRVQQKVSDCLAIGYVEDFDFLLNVTFEKHDRANLALGAALLCYGLDRFMAEALPQPDQSPVLRLSNQEKEQKLADLSRKLHESEIDEEDMVQALGVDRREGCSAAAVLGVPWEVLNVD